MTMTSSALNTVDMLVLIGYFGLVLIVGLGSSLLKGNQSSLDGFFLAGRHMSWLPVGASLFASNIGSEHFIGLAGTGAATGIAVGAFELNALVLLQLLGFVFLPVYIRSGVSTLPEYLRRRFGRHRIQALITLLSLALYIFTKISVNLYSGSLFIQQALQWDLWPSMALLLLMTCICTVVGGLTSVIYMDLLQVSVMILGSSILLYRGLERVGGFQKLQESYMRALPNVIVKNEFNETCGLPNSDAWQILRAADSKDMPWPGFILGQTPASIWYWCADQMMVQKALSARSLSDAQGATLFTGWLKVLPLFLMVVPGMISRVLYPDEVGCIEPSVCESVCNNAKGCSNIAFPRLVLGVMPMGLRGVMVAVMLAALMSDLTSIFNSASTLFTMDVYRHLRSEPSQKELLLTGRITIIILVAISTAWIPVIEGLQGGQLYIYIQAVAAYLTPPIAMVFSLAIFWPRFNENGAFWALVYGMGVGLVRMVIDFTLPEATCVSPWTTRPDFFLANMHYMYFAAFSFWTTGIVSIVISYCTKPCKPFRIVRTTVWTKGSNEPRFEEQVEMDEFVKTGVKDKKANSGNNTNLLSDHLKPKERASYCSVNVLTTLRQSDFEKLFLRLNLLLILVAALGLYGYFSINPFSQEDIKRLRANLTFKVVHF